MKNSFSVHDWWPVACVVGLGIGLTVSGCSAAGQGRYNNQEDHSEGTALTKGCAFDDIFDPGPPELENAIRRSASLWQAATGRPICVETGGLPFKLSTDVKGDRDYQVCGFTWQYWYSSPEAWAWNQYIEIHQIDETVTCYSYDSIILHEMGHALGHRKDHVDAGLMGLYALPEVMINQSAIDYVCRDTDCY